MSLGSFAVEILSVLGAVVGTAFALDTLLSDSVKIRLSESLLTVRSVSVSRYVASNTLTLFHLLFSRTFLSWRFVVRSMLFTLLSVTFCLIYIWFAFPVTFIQATNYITNALLGYQSLWIVVPPFIVILLFDYLCNGKTKYFLSLMIEPERSKSFPLVAYSEIVVTISLAILSVSLSATLFSILYLHFVNHEVNMKMAFSELEQRTDEGQEVLSFTITHQPNEFNKYLFMEEVEDISQNPFPNGNIIDYTEEEDGTNVLRYLNDGGITMSYNYIGPLSAHRYILELGEGGDVSDMDTFCAAVSRSARHPNFRLTVQEGWDIGRIRDSCLTGKDVELELLATLNAALISPRRIYSFVTSNLIRLSYSSVPGRFSEYFLDGPTMLVPGFLPGRRFYIGDDSGIEGSVSNSAYISFYQNMAGGRYFQINGMPWSSFFVATMFTSGFMWISVLLMLMLYPAVFVLRLILNDASEQGPIAKIDEYPITTVAMVASLYLVVLLIFI